MQILSRKARNFGGYTLLGGVVQHESYFAGNARLGTSLETLTTFRAADVTLALTDLLTTAELGVLKVAQWAIFKTLSCACVQE